MLQYKIPTRGEYGSMKRRKSTWMILLAVVLSVAMVISGMSFVAFGAITGDANTLINNVDMPSKVEYGKTFDIPAVADVAADAITVTAPNGKDATKTGNTVTADQVGTYTVTFSKGTKGEDGYQAYDFYVYSSVAEDYEIKVDFNGADIPTYLKKGDSMTLPKAQLVYYDEDGKMQPAPGTQTVKAKVVNGDKTTEFTVSGDVTDESRKYTPENNGLVYVQYFVKLDGNTKVYTKDFTVKVQTEVNDNAAPTLSIVNVPTEASINRKVTLPTATVNDDLDENVKVEITVKKGDDLVKQVELNADGYAKNTIDATEVFDNDKLMSFYPTELGDKNYTVTYQATDDAGKKSAPYTYQISGVDKVAPVFKDIDEHQIPEKWGLTVKTVEQNEDGTVTETPESVDAGISFPTPIVVDNAGDKDLTVSFKITNSDNATVMSFDNILDKSAEGKGKIFTSNGANYGEKDEKFTFGAFKFDFNKVKNTDPQTGTYTVEYRAKDAKGNVATKTYKITVESTYKDEKAPVAADLETPDYLIAKEGETFVVPTPSVADAEAATTRLHVEYEIVSDAPGTEPLKVKGGEKAEIVKDGDSLVFKIDDTKKLTLNKNLTFNLKVSDSVGLSKENKKDGASLNVVRVVSTTSVTNAPAITANIQEKKTEDAAWTTADTVNAGGFTIEVAEENYPFTGFEVRVTNPKGETLDNVSLETYYDYSTIVVRNLTFTPGTSGTYQIAVRAFTLAEKNTVAIYPIAVEGDSTSGGSTDKPKGSAISMPTSGSAYTAYKLQDTRFDNIPGVDHAYLAHKITGAGFSLMGSEFIAYNQGTYQFTAGYIDSANANNDLVTRRTYSISTTDTEKPVIEVQGLMPTYSPKKVKDEDNNVVLPPVVAIGEHGNADIDVQITKNGEDVTATPTEDGGYSFEPRKDGAYTVTYTAALNGSDPVTATFTVNVGDVVAPDFKVTSTPVEKARINSEFKFSALTLDSSEDAISDCTFTKKLIDPSKAEVVSISGKGSTYAGKTDNGATIKLDKSGTYTVVYEVSDEAGNKTTLQYQIVVSAQKSSSNISLTMISTVLIIVGVILIAGVIIYFVRYRKVKPKKEKK